VLPSLPVCGRGVVHRHSTKAVILGKIERAELASQMRTAFSKIASNTGPSSPGELEMTRSTSVLAIDARRMRPTNHKAVAPSIVEGRDNESGRNRCRITWFDHSILIFASRTTARHLSDSTFIWAANSSGVLTKGSKPSTAKRCLISGSAMTLAN
jgi:hypothetical protein